ncbi:hypothetical protein, partial [Streptomyces rubiginosohelvolus]|uniref:hypothetical protein n=1 Tax=Streptomyces rubiginosohelvolus TaxID=67362 RepID=UPI0036BC52CC
MEKTTGPEEAMATGNRQNSESNVARIITHLQKRSPRLGHIRHLYEGSVAEYDGVHATFDDGYSKMLLTTYDYLGLLGDKRLNDAAKEAVD